MPLGKRKGTLITSKQRIFFPGKGFKLTKVFASPSFNKKLSAKIEKEIKKKNKDIFGNFGIKLFLEILHKEAVNLIKRKENLFLVNGIITEQLISKSINYAGLKGVLARDFRRLMRVEYWYRVNKLLLKQEIKQLNKASNHKKIEKYENKLNNLKNKTKKAINKLKIDLTKFKKNDSKNKNVIKAIQALRNLSVEAKEVFKNTPEVFILEKYTGF